MNKREAEIIYEASRPTDFPPVMKEWLLKKGFKKNIIERSHHTEWRYLHEIDVTVPDPYDADNRLPKLFMTVAPEPYTNSLPWRVNVIERLDEFKYNPGTMYHDIIMIPNTRQLETAWARYRELAEDIEKDDLSDWDLEESYSGREFVDLPDEIKEHLLELGFKQEVKQSTIYPDVIVYKLNQGKEVTPVYNNKPVDQYSIWFSASRVIPDTIEGRFYIISDEGYAIDNAQDTMTDIRMNDPDMKSKVDQLIQSYESKIKGTDDLAEWDF